MGVGRGLAPAVLRFPPHFNGVCRAYGLLPPQASFLGEAIGAAAPLPPPLGEVSAEQADGEGFSPLSQKSKIFASSPTGRAKP